MAAGHCRTAERGGRAIGGVADEDALMDRAATSLLPCQYLSRWVVRTAWQRMLTVATGVRLVAMCPQPKSKLDIGRRHCSGICHPSRRGALPDVAEGARSELAELQIAPSPVNQVAPPEPWGL